MRRAMPLATPAMMPTPEPTPSLAVLIPEPLSTTLRPHTVLPQIEPTPQQAQARAGPPNARRNANDMSSHRASVLTL
jgi:hypothetical protein